MKRSEINTRIDLAIAFCDQQKFYLPKWATWSPDDWAEAGPEADEIRQRLLGWDLTDFGSGDYDRKGLLLFTIRNGEISHDGDRMAKDYCEKLLLMGEEQVTPTHFHWAKMEDIINRGGGNMVIELWNADPDTEELDDVNEVTVSVDGIERTVPAGGKVVLEPGESITLPPYMYHTFYGQAGKGMVLGGEVSRVNDDANDNRFLQPLPRFPEIEEDQPVDFLLCTEYPPAAG
jgi:D-lyxose ketol-isomerase